MEAQQNLEQKDNQPTLIEDQIARKASADQLPKRKSSNNEMPPQKVDFDQYSIFIENVDYNLSKQDLQLVFQDCGAIERSTILTNKMTKKPLGRAYVKFFQEKGLQNALFLNGTKLRNRIIKIQKKRTNMPGMSKYNSEVEQLKIVSELFSSVRASGNRGRGRGRQQ